MVKHMIIWKLNDCPEGKAARKKKIKDALEGLVGKIDGLVEMRILTDGFDSCSGDVMMDSLFEDKEALDAYQNDPLHKEVAQGVVRPSVCERLSFDFEV